MRQLMVDHPDWHRSRLSQEICNAWNWVNATGQLKDMACRTMLLKLERQGYLQLPPARTVCVGNSVRYPVPIAHATDEIICKLRDLMPLHIEVSHHAASSRLFKHLLTEYHYLGFSGTIGENMKYLIFDNQQRPLACMLFGSAAWKVASRDEWMGWSSNIRQASLLFITNNMRFLILPWVRVPHLASHLLGSISRRISADWIHKYGHPIHLLETFVERERFRGTCYRAANWIRLGQTQGRSRNDTHRTLQVPTKDVYVYPLIRNVQEVLAREARGHSKNL
ncbi:MAG: Druantia anti-phage system protein DruA [Paenibacillaceae bacterium]